MVFNEDIFECFNISITFLQLSFSNTIDNLASMSCYLLAETIAGIKSSTKLLIACVLSQNKGNFCIPKR